MFLCSPGSASAGCASAPSPPTRTRGAARAGVRARPRTTAPRTAPGSWSGSRAWVAWCSARPPSATASPGPVWSRPGRPHWKTVVQFIVEKTWKHDKTIGKMTFWGSELLSWMFILIKDISTKKKSHRAILLRNKYKILKELLLLPEKLYLN